MAATETLRQALELLGSVALLEAGARNSKTDLQHLQSIHDAATKLGAKCDDPAEEAKESQAIDITGDVIALKEGAVGQDGSAYLKLIQPGRGSSGYYPESVLERDGPATFPKGTRSFWNHQTDAEESARPEGDLRDLASVLTEDAHYEKNGPAGPGLYARARVFEQFRQPIDDLARHIGVSIRATGTAKEGTAPDGKKGPIIEKLTRGISVDYVTQPGAGGQVLQLFEAARKRPDTALTTVTSTNHTTGYTFMPYTVGDPAVITYPGSTGEQSMMTEAEKAQIQALESSAAESKLVIRRFRERFALTDAAGVIGAYFSTVSVAEGIRARVTARLLSGTVPLTEAGDLDKDKLTKIAEAETADETAYISSLSGGRIVTGMGRLQEAQPTEAQKQEATKLREAESIRSASGYGLKTKEGKRIFLEGRAAFNPEFNSADKEEVA